jgi:DNA polymerase-3 subunit epsilon
MVDNSARTLHGALLDAEILADVFLLMTGGQTALFAGESEDGNGTSAEDEPTRLDADRPALKVITATVEEASAHEAWLDLLDQKADKGSVWRRLEQA